MMSHGAPAHPPTAVPETLRRDPVWPTTVGLCGIVYALFHIGVASLIILLFYYAIGPSSYGIGFYPNTAMQPGLGDILPSMRLAMLNLFLLVASTLVARRKRIGVILSLWWAWLYLVHFVAFILFFLLSAQDATPPAQQAALPAAGSAVPLAALTVILEFLYIVLQTGWPIFLICWFARTSTKQTVATWC